MILKEIVGEKWHQMRATLSPSFTSSKMKAMCSLIEECAENFTKFFWEKKESVVDVDLKDVFRRYGNDVIATVAFGIHCNSVKEVDNEFYIHGRQATNFTGVWINIKFFLIGAFPTVSKVCIICCYDSNKTSLRTF